MADDISVLIYLQKIYNIPHLDVLHTEWRDFNSMLEYSKNGTLKIIYTIFFPKHKTVWLYNRAMSQK